MELFFIWIVAGILTGAIAKAKGRSMLGWAFLGFLCPILFLPLAIIIK